MTVLKIRMPDIILVEIGNTSVKAVRVQNGERYSLFKIGTNEVDLLREKLSALHSKETILLSSVRKDLISVFREFDNRFKIYSIKYDQLGKIGLDYDTPATLGIDRVLACAGAVHHAKTDVVVVDAGTACTVDLMTSAYCFKGGVIMPGLPMLRHSMRSLTPELPEVEQVFSKQFPGRSTKESIKIGLNGGFVHSIEKFINDYKSRLDGVEIYITGGDGEFVQKALPENIKTQYHENLVFDGMLAWLEVNQEEL